MLDLLSNLYLFKPMKPDQLKLISDIAKVSTIPAAKVVFKQGDEANSLFVIKRGVVKIEHEMADGNKVEVATLATGSHFGEVGLLEKHKRTATATTDSVTELVEIDYEALEKVLSENPSLAALFYREVGRFLSSRLRLTTLDLSYSRNQNLSHF